MACHPSQNTVIAHAEKPWKKLKCGLGSVGNENLEVHQLTQAVRNRGYDVGTAVVASKLRGVYDPSVWLKPTEGYSYAIVA